jgi:hypothetical protein
VGPLVRGAPRFRSPHASASAAAQRRPAPQRSSNGEENWRTTGEARADGGMEPLRGQRGGEFPGPLG